MNKKKITIVGDIILDKYIVGSTSRISPEAPVPIIKIETEKYTLGGAANVAHNVSNLGIDTIMLGALGEDREANIVKTLSEEKNLETHFFSTNKILTTTKTRIISRNQQMLRLDSESVFNHDPKSIEYFKNKFSENNLIIVSDYAKGFCSEDFMNLLFLSKQKEVKVLIDPKGINWKKYNGAFLVKPNLSELEEVSGKSIKNNNEEVASHGMKVFNKYNFENLVVTRGNKGMTLINEKGVLHFETKNVDVYDVSGAGDTAMAVLATMILKGKTIEEAIKIANMASSYVVTKPMTYAIDYNELENLLN